MGRSRELEVSGPLRGVFMDKVLKITSVLLILVLALIIGYTGYTGFVMTSYQDSLAGTYSYTLSITTDKQLSDVTFFIPVPEDRTGNSMAVTLFSANAMPGVPESWQTTLFDTGKATLLKIHIPELETPLGTTAQNPYTVTMAATLPADAVIDTADPGMNSPVFSPMQDYRSVECTGSGAGSGGSPECAAFATPLYADYTADPNAAVTITSSWSGRNSWTVFEPRSNEYMTTISLLMHGENHGWTTAKGTIASRIGSYEYPFHLT